MATSAIVFHRQTVANATARTAPARDADSDGELARFLDVFGSPFPPDIWSGCPSTCSTDPADLARFWTFLRANPLARFWLKKLLERLCADPADVRNRDLPTWLMLLELQLVRGDYAECVARAELLSAHYSADLRVQDVRARANLLAEDDSRLASDLSYAYKPFADRYCPSTFESLCFFDHGAYICCCNYQPASIGSTAAKSVGDLWNGAIAQDIRKSILDGSFRYCNKMVCPRLRNRDLPLRDSESLSAYDRAIVANGATTSPGCYPRVIELNEDPSCNLVCPSCRGAPVHRDTQFLRDFERAVLPGVLENELRSFLVACYGEPLASSHYLRALKSLDPARHRIGWLVLYTNAVLLTPAKWAELRNLHPYKIEIRISIDAATASTYARVRPAIGREGDWDALGRNLRFVKELRAERRIRRLKLFFVVQKENFREMLDFIRLAKDLGADEVVFAEMQQYGRYFGNDELYARNAVHLSGHPDHSEYRQMLSDPLFQDPIVSFHGSRLQHDAERHPIYSATTNGASHATRAPSAPARQTVAAADDDTPTYAWAGDANAATIAESVPIPADGQFHRVLSLPLNKHSSQSNWFYTAQITVQQGSEGLYGAQFKMVVRRQADGEPVMSPMITGQLIPVPNALVNASMSDTVQDMSTGSTLVAGDYAFELYALSGGGALLVLGTMTTISVLEIPHPRRS